MKKMIYTVILLMGILLTAGLSGVRAQAMEEKSIRDTATPGDAGYEPEQQDGWIIGPGEKRQYYVEGKPVADRLMEIVDESEQNAAGSGTPYYYYFDQNGYLAYGLVTVNGNSYFFDSADKKHKGAAVRGWKTVAGKTYYFDDETCRAKKGLQYVGTEKCFFDRTTGVVQTGFVTSNNKTYYFDRKTYAAKKGLCTINGKKYYFAPNCVMAKNTPVVVNGKKYYFTGNGTAQTGFAKIGADKYYFDQNAVMQKNCFKKIGTVTYYFGNNGRAYHDGIKKIGNDYYYFSNSCAMHRYKWIKYNGKNYFIGSDGKAYKGAHTVKGSKYYYYFNSQGQLAGGTATVNGLHYRFRSNGRPYQGLYTTPEGIKYYYNSYGALTKGAAIVGGSYYLFGLDGKWVTKQGWYNVKNKRYYVQGNKRIARGYADIDGNQYYFDNKGVMLKREWKYVNGYKFYFGNDGKRLLDVDAIIGKQDSYEIEVNQQLNVVTVYAKDGDKGYIIPVKAFVCSGGNETPIGTFYTLGKYRWNELIGPCWGQWCTHICGNVLFHSVYYNSENDNMNLSVSAYNNLGTTCSHGCVRLTAGDAKWLYDNCKVGTKVTIFRSSEEGPFPKPEAVKLPSWHTWDPTDPNVQSKCRANGCH